MTNMKKLLMGLALIAALTLTAEAKTWRFELRNDPADYGSGSIIATLYYPGGIPQVGTFAGHPNSSTRRDRVVFRFDITNLYLLTGEPDIEDAWVEFSTTSLYGPAGDRKIQCEHLDYEHFTMGAEDLTNDRATKVLEEPVRRGRFRADVTEPVRDDLKHFRFFSMFRVADTAGDVTNTSADAIGVGVRTPFEGAGDDNPVLVIITRN